MISFLNLTRIYWKHSNFQTEEMDKKAAPNIPLISGLQDMSFLRQFLTSVTKYGAIMLPTRAKQDPPPRATFLMTVGKSSTVNM